MRSPIGRAGVGRLIALEAIDGAGKTVQARRLVDALRASGRAAHLTRQPSDGPVGRLLREVLVGEHAVPEGSVSRHTLGLLFAADRVDHLQREVYPRLAAGDIVVSDRWYHSSYAYQVTSERDFAWIATINQQARRPDLTIFLEVRLEIAARRRAEAGRLAELFDDAATQAQVSRAYARALDYLVARGERIAVVDGELDEAEVGRRVYAAAERVLTMASST